MPELAARLPQILENMAQADIRQAIAISVDKTSAAEVLALAEQHTNLFASVGVHPEDQNSVEISLDEFIVAAQHPKVVGIGETGLDYHWYSGDLTWQHARFRTHIQASNHTGLPLIIHTRDAGADTLRLLRENQAQQGVIHCFTEDTAFAKAVLDLGFYISFSGIVTFKNARQIQEACRYVPLDRILVETDAPYLAPVPKRGKPNEPAYVRYTAEFVAQLRGDSITTIEEATTANTYRLFNKLPPLNN
ncbi:putative deoxyribonuclease YcfH [Snodgrassella communis]|uniref:Putative deoxyribonuclease YcfH n=2 Tax=Snodgrassella communis TaxID=2946699 RepID=A0A836MPG9_9NEIS|nr:putative deoxyribonuclease YcfH [Snodgrassella communis]KDN13865.1 putative deoxyribonuclease YcfH [Snodgrassella communis]